MTRTRYASVSVHMAIFSCSAAMLVSGCAQNQPDAASTEEELLAAAVTAKGLPLRTPVLSPYRSIQ